MQDHWIDSFKSENSALKPTVGRNKVFNLAEKKYENQTGLVESWIFRRNYLVVVVFFTYFTRISLIWSFNMLISYCQQLIGRIHSVIVIFLLFIFRRKEILWFNFKQHFRLISFVLKLIKNEWKLFLKFEIFCPYLVISENTL